MNQLIVFPLAIFCWFLSGGVNAQKKSTPASEIKYFEHSEEMMIMAGPVVESFKVIYNKSGTNIKGIHCWSSQGFSRSYFTGQISGNRIKGKMYDLADGSASNFYFIKGAKALNITYYGKERFWIPEKKKIEFNGTNFTLFEKPDRKSAVIEADCPLEERNFRIVEIGQMEKDGEEENSGYDVWYRLSNGTQTGWAFGIISGL